MLNEIYISDIYTKYTNEYKFKILNCFYHFQYYNIEIHLY